jgi:predicted ATPase/DNA-binding CsgD family transcriptional regulator
MATRRFRSDDPWHGDALSWKSNVPTPATSLIGRELETAKLISLLLDGQTQLITLTGPGGVGKTRLALRIADDPDIRDGYGIVFLPLASVTDPDLVAPTIGREFGLRVDDTEALPGRLANTLEGQPCLLILDNFEQILSAAPLVANLVNSCPTLTVLVTSRSPLRLSVEREWPVPSLMLPDPESAPGHVIRSASAQLFIERAGWEPEHLTPQDSSSIAAICRRLDGLPLAIELAAASTRILSSSELLSRMDRALPLLVDGPRDAPARLQTMRNAIGWSYDLLSADQQRLFRALSVFQGGFTLAAAEAIAAADLEMPPFQALAALIDHSLISRMPGDQESSRFTMLETIREFGLEELRACGEEDTIRERHLSWFIEQAGSPTPEQWLLPEASRAFRLPGEQDNLRSALNWTLDHNDTASAAKIAHGLLGFWRSNGFFREAVSSLDCLLSRSERPDPLLEAGVIWRIGGFVYQLGDFSRTRDLATRGLQICREIGHLPGIVDHLHGLGMVATWTDGPEAIRLFDEAIDISRALGNARLLATQLFHRAHTYTVHADLDRASVDLASMFSVLAESSEAQPMLVYALGLSGWIAGLRHDLDQAERIAREMLVLADDEGIRELQQWGRRALGNAAFAKMDYESATDWFQRALHLVYQSALPLWEGFCFAELAMVARSQGESGQAARLFGAAETIWIHLGIPPSARTTMAGWSHDGSPAASDMADEQFAAAFTAGQQLTRAQAYAEAMAVAVAPRSTISGGSILSPRELEVLMLIADGHTNREIADLLFVSTRTVDSHVLSILAKLGVDSRRDAIKSARKRGLLAPAKNET